MTDDNIDAALFAEECPFTHIGRIHVNTSTRALKSGFRDLERMEFMRAGESDLVVIGARPGAGKSAFLIQTALNVAKSEGDILVFSLEMSKEQLKRRVLADVTGTGMRNLGMIQESRILSVNSELEASVPLLLDDTKGLTINMLRARAMAYVRRKPLRAVGIDYLQLVRTNIGRSKREEILEVVEGIKQLACDINCPVIALAQMSREIEKRQQFSKTAKPVMSDLQECGGIENFADQIMFLDAAWRRDPARAQEVDCYIEKNRHGTCGKIVLKFDGNLMRFSDMEEGL